tara:strand:+ start:414 stop:857 length:444 start_codon:yes stop_codon:yes gene_type:complete
MAFSHTNKITFEYTDNGGVASKSVSKAETSGAQVSIEEAITTDSSSATADIDLEYFEFTTASKAVSVYLRIDGFNCALYANGSGGTKMADLDDGEPYVWSYNGGTNFPAGNSNPMVDSTTKLTVRPDSDAGTDTAGTLTVKVLYDPT